MKMSQRPLRSKGCITCRRRKVKCDEAKPSCNRCKKAYIPCEGYGNQGDHPRIIIYKASPNVVPIGDGDANEPVSRLKPASVPITQPTVPSSLGLQAFKEDMWVAYTSQKLFPGPGSPLSGRKQSWILCLASEKDASVAYTAVCCLSAMFFSKLNGISTEDSKEGARYYGKALSDLATMLKDPERWKEPSIIAATLLLGMYELVAFSDRNGWIQHAGGVGKLIEMRGPQAHQDEPANTYFHLARLQIISRALVIRRRTFLEREEWLSTAFTYNIPEVTIPWQYQTNRVIDILARFPGLREDGTSIRGLSTASLDRPDKINFHRQKIVDILRDLFLWRWEWERTNQHIADEVLLDPVNSLTLDEEGSPLYHNLIRYYNLNTARAPLLYNTAVLLALKHAAQWNILNGPSVALSSFSEEGRPKSSSSLMMPHPDMTVMDPVNEICRSVEWFLRSPSEGAVALVLMLPLRCVLDSIPRGKLKSWVDNILHLMAQTHPFSFTQRLANHERLALSSAAEYVPDDY